nr:AMP-binding protein [Mesorhizobium sp.]
MNIANWLSATAKRHPERAALLHGADVVANYAQFAGRAADRGSALASRFRVQPGDRVALYMSNRTEYLESLYATWWIGAVAVPINRKLHVNEAAWIVGNAGAKIVLADEDDLAELGSAVGARIQVLAVNDPIAATPHHRSDLPPPAARQPSDLAWLFYTSGTTGRPKGAMLTHGNLVAMSLSYLADVDTVGPDDTAIYAAPLSHGAGLYNFIHVRAGARHCVPETGGFDAPEVLTLASQLGNASLFAAPTMVRRLVDAVEAGLGDGDGLRTVVYGGGPMYLSDMERALAIMGDKFVQIYGQGESPMTITALSRSDHGLTGDPRHRARIASVGRAHSVVELRIVDEDGSPLAEGQDGEIIVKGPTVMAGYWENPEATASALRDGWLFTGDIGRIDAEGYLTLTDRSKDVIICGGSNVYPREVEEVLLSHGGISEVSVVGQRDAEWGEIIVAFVVARPEHALSAAELDAHCLAALARFKRPKRYVWLKDLPKNNYGKVLKTELRKLLD